MPPCREHGGILDSTFSESGFIGIANQTKIVANNICGHTFPPMIRNPPQFPLGLNVRSYQVKYKHKPDEQDE
jgi:hypothetical protein